MKASLVIAGTDVFDAYILLEAINYWNGEIRFSDSFRFVKNESGKIDRISHIDGRVSIAMEEPDRVRLSVSDQLVDSASK